MIAGFVFAASISLNAQKKTKISYLNTTGIGILSGQQQNSFTVQTINGVKWDKWSAGIGVALDNYANKSIPVFVDVRRSFGNAKWKPLLYADAGINFNVYSEKYPKPQFNEYSLNNGFYGGAGIGLTTSISKKKSFIITAGYSYKQFNWSEPYTMWSSFRPAGVDINALVQNTHHYRRWALIAGLSF